MCNNPETSNTISLGGCKHPGYNAPLRVLVFVHQMQSPPGTEVSGPKSILLREILAFSPHSIFRRLGVRARTYPPHLRDRPSSGAGLRAPPSSAAPAAPAAAALPSDPKSCSAGRRGGQRRRELRELLGPASFPFPPPTPAWTHAQLRSAEAAAGESRMEGVGG